jgi:hypothetical protein
LVIAGPPGLKERMVSRAKLGCTRLILTHMSDDMIRRARDLPVECAEDAAYPLVTSSRS